MQKIYKASTLAISKTLEILVIYGAMAAIYGFFAYAFWDGATNHPLVLACCIGAGILIETAKVNKRQS
jgi:hypothetical protein